MIPFGAKIIRPVPLLVGLLLIAGAVLAEVPAPADSSLIAAFLAQPEDSLKSRRTEAEHLVSQALRSTHGPRRLDFLTIATRRDPASVPSWLALAETQGDMGRLSEVKSSLASARSALDFLGKDQRRDAVRDYSIAVAWFHFEMGNWDAGRRWGERAVRYQAGMDAHLVTALCSAQAARSLDEFSAACFAFQPLSGGGNRRANLSWAKLMHFYLKKYTFEGIQVSGWVTRSTAYYQKDVSRWRGYGAYCEGNLSFKLAAKFYHKSRQAVRIADGDWLTTREHPIGGVSTPPPAMPFWVNGNEEFVTGSLLAYYTQLNDGMKAGASPQEKRAWAARLLACAERVDSWYPYWPWVGLMRTEALLTLGQPWEAENVIEIVSAKFKALDIKEPNLDRVHGHVLLLVNQPVRADPMIRRAAPSFPADASCQSDLGLVEVMAGNPADALAAFDRALELDPELTVAWYNRGLLKSHEGQFEEALADIQQAAVLQPDDPNIAEFRTQLMHRVQLDKQH